MAEQALPPDDLPVYRLTTGPDDEQFCRRVSAALAMGYRLNGSAFIAATATGIIASQAVIWKGWVHNS